MHTKVMQVVLVLFLFGATSCGKGTSSEAHRGPPVIDPAKIVGCRAPTPGCETCCESVPPGHVLHSTNMANWYNQTAGGDGACPAGVPACARCSTRDEENLRELAGGRQCNCAGVKPGFDPCFNDDCACFCSTFARLEQACTRSAAH